MFLNIKKFMLMLAMIPHAVSNVSSYFDSCVD